MNGTAFTKVFGAGLGNPDNQRPYGLFTMNSNLYVMFRNDVTGAEIYRTSNGANWTNLTNYGSGWGDQLNAGCSYFNKGIVVFNGSLYCGTMGNDGKGSQVWRYNNPLVTVTITSTGPQDGWILEKAQGSGTGGTVGPATASTFQLGDSPANQQYRAILSFPTYTLPKGAVIKSAVLKIKPSGALTGINPFTIFGNLYADIRKGFFGTAATLELADFNAAPTLPKAATFGKTPVNGWYTAPISGIGNINQTMNGNGLTQFRLYFNIPTNSNLKADWMPFWSGDYATINLRPQLVITYAP